MPSPRGLLVLVIAFCSCGTPMTQPQPDGVADATTRPAPPRLENHDTAAPSSAMDARIAADASGPSIDAVPPPPSADGPPAAPADAPDSRPAGGPLDGVGSPQQVASGFQFAEGPTWLPGAGVLVFSDVRAARLLKLAPPKTVTTFRERSLRANGNAVDAAGNLYTCERETRRVSRTTPAGEISVWADRVAGAPFGDPNDLVVRRDGTVFFTDFAARRIISIGPAPARATAVAATIDGSPNGIALSPDETVLYVTDFAKARLLSFAVTPTGLRDQATLAKVGPDPDGMGVDDQGHLYVTTTAGLEVLTPAGKPIGIIKLPTRPTNCAFGGNDRRTLYITTATALYEVRVPIPGTF